MPVVKRSKESVFSPEQMYGLVNDVRAYPEFLPWCAQADVLSEDKDEVRATLHLAKGALRKSFTTCNRLQHNKMIEVRLVSGPFRHLEGFWCFEGTENNGCRVTLDLEFEFANRIISTVIGPIFSQIANTLVDAFCARADELYG